MKSNKPLGQRTFIMKRSFITALLLICLSPTISGQTGESSYVEQPLAKAIDRDLEKSEGRRDFLFDGRQIKSKSKVIYTADTRPLEPKKKRFLELWLEARQLSPKTIDLLLQEVRFREGDKDYWLPVRKKILGDISAKFRNGDEIKIHTILAGGVQFGGSVEWVFIVGDYSH